MYFINDYNLNKARVYFLHIPLAQNNSLMSVLSESTKPNLNLNCTFRTQCHPGFIQSPGKQETMCLADGTWNNQLKCEVGYYSHLAAYSSIKRFFARYFFSLNFWSSCRKCLLGFIPLIWTRILFWTSFKFFAIFKVFCQKVYLEGTFWIY